MFKAAVAFILMALLVQPAIAAGVDLQHCNPLADDACRKAMNAHVRAYDRAHPNAIKAEGNHTVISVERTEDYCRRQALAEGDPHLPDDGARWLPYRLHACFAQHPGPTVTVNRSLLVGVGGQP